MSYLFFGETHGFLDDFSEIKKYVESFNPEVILYEQLQDKIMPPYVFEQFSPLVDIAEISPLIKLCSQKNIPLIGCDLVDFGLSKQLQKAINAQNATPDELLAIAKVVELREAHQLKCVLLQKESRIMVVVGAWHLREGAPLRNIPARIIVPCINGKQVFEPTQGAVFQEL